MEEKMTFRSRLKSAWNAFFNKDPTNTKWGDYGNPYYHRPDRYTMSRRSERTIVAAIYNRIGTDSASMDVKHVKLDENGRFLKEIDSGLNNCLTLEANTDQTGRQFIQDVVISMLDEGVVAIVPTDTDEDPMKTNSWDVLTMRVGRIVEWYPQHVKVECYDERDGQKKEVIWPKTFVAIVENPFYAVMNERNSTMQRLIRKLSLLDAADEQAGSGKLNMIIQLPYIIKTESRKAQAEARRKDIEQQLTASKYGIAYTDATEHITQLNRALDNNLMTQIEYLTKLLFSQLGITQEILDGTADEKTMLNYYSRTIEPILAAITLEMKRKFLTKTARTQGQSVEFFRDPFKLVPMSDLAELSDKLTRNEIMSSNEVRQIIGLVPSDDPSADELRNKNINQAAPAGAEGMEGMGATAGIQNEGEEGAGPSDAELQQADDDIVEQLLQSLEEQINQIIDGAMGNSESEEEKEKENDSG
jgi:hypothetical protein